MAITADAVSYLWSALFVALIRKKEPRVARGPAGRPKTRREIMEGLRYVLGNRYLRPIAACTATSNLFLGMAFPVFLVFAVRAPARHGLGLSPGELGLALSIGNVGVLGGAFMSKRVADRLTLGPTIVGSAVLFSIAWVLVPLATPSTAFPILVIVMLLGGTGGVIYNVNQVSLRQAMTPDWFQGRMNATMRFMVWGTMPIGSFLGGILGGRIGLRPALWVAAIGGLFAFVPPLLSPVRTLERIPEMTETAAGGPEAAAVAGQN